MITKSARVAETWAARVAEHRALQMLLEAEAPEERGDIDLVIRMGPDPQHRMDAREERRDDRDRSSGGRNEEEGKTGCESAVAHR